MDEKIYFPAAQYLAAQQPEERRSIYVVLVNTSSIVSKMISALTADEYTHAAISLDPALDEMFSFGRRWPRYPFWGCFKRENFFEGFYALNPTLPGTVLQIDVTLEQYRNVQGIIRYFQANSASLRYDVMGLFMGALGIPFESSRYYTCSKFVADVLQGAGVCSFDKSIPLVRPQDFLRFPFCRIYTGDLKQYGRQTPAAAS